MEEQQNTQLTHRSDALEEIITSIPTWIIRYGNIVLLIIVSLMLLLSYLIKYPETVVSEVIITTTDPPQKIFTRISGTVDSVFVQNNDTIIINDPIALIENSANYNHVKYLKDLISKLDFKDDGNWFPMDGFPALLLGELEDPFSRFENSYIKYILLKKYKDYDIRSATNIKNSTERRKKLASLTSQYELNSKELELMRLDVERSDQLYKKGIISRQENEKKEMEYVRSEKLAKNNLIDISELKNDMILSEQDLKLTNIEKIRDEGNVEKVLFQNLDKLKVAIRDWEQKFILKSARNGRVTFLRDLKKNDYLQEKQLVVSVVPTNNLKPIAKLKTNIKNSGKIKIGQRVHIMLENYSYIEYGMLIGTVSNISLIPDADNFYFIDVALNNELVTTYNKRLDFKYELFGQAEIITQDVRLIERVLHQLKNLVNN
jgi:multidrug resistance efflux pump